MDYWIGNQRRRGRTKNMNEILNPLCNKFPFSSDVELC